MKKTFQKSLLVAAVAASLASVSMAAEVGTTNLLFPYVSSGASAFTFLTVSNRANGLAGTRTMHFSYGMKASTAATTAGCEHANGNGTITQNDVTQFEMSNKVNVATSLANGDTNGGFAWTGGADKQGFLIVNTNGFSGDVVYGSAVVVDTASGLRMAYSTQGLNTTDALDADFSADNIAGSGGPEASVIAVAAAAGVPAVAASPAPVGAGAAAHVLTWYATPSVTSSWYVVPLGLESAMTPSAFVGGINGTYSMYNTAATLGGAYDMKEVFTSGSLPKVVRCAGVITRADVLQSGALANSNLGGMGLLSTLTAAGAPTAANAFAGAGATVNKSLVYSVQSTTLLGGSQTYINRVTRF